MGELLRIVPVYAGPNATGAPIPLGPIGFRAELVPHDGNPVRIGLQDPAFPYSSAFAINDAGQAVGQSWGPNGISHAFVFTNHQTLDLNNLIPTLPQWTITSAKNIDDQGRILAEATRDGEDHTVVLLTQAVPEPSMLVVGLSLVGAVAFRRARRIHPTARRARPTHE
jgi:probable HAF family extracellular repeat protein